MKLKKIVSLALAGIMAVSMLAGCNTSSSTTTEDPTDVTTNSSIVTIVNAAIAGNDAGISFASNAAFTKALEKVITLEGVEAGETALTAAMAAELDIDPNGDSSAGFAAAGLNPTSVAEGDYETVQVYVVSGKNETALSVSYGIAAKVAEVVNALKVNAADGGDIYNYTYSNAYLTMMEVTVDSTNYYFIAVGLNASCAEA